MKHIVNPNWVLARMYEPDLVIVDCRFHLNNPALGREQYEAARIPRAVYFDLDRDLSSKPGLHGGRHPLPDPEELALKLGKAGIDDSVRVVAYDDQGGAMAARFWWLLAYMGHTRAFVMDEGFTSWTNKGFPVASEPPAQVVPKTFLMKPQTEWVADMPEVKAKLDDPETILVDSREAARYAGLEEPIDPVAGHIPGAVHYFWKDNLGEGGKWLNGDQLQERFAKLDREREIIVYCGSGVTACPNVLALKEAGFQRVKLYAGSWSDWISYSENPIATGEE